MPENYMPENYLMSQGYLALRNVKFTLILLLLHCNVFSQTATSSVNAPKWHQSQVFKTVAVPALLMGYGVSTWGSNGFPLSSQQVQQGRQQYFQNFHTRFDDFTPLMPVIAVYGLDATGIKSKHNFVDRTILYVLAGALANVTTLTLKESTHHMRPDSSTYNSFPSGHTSNAFVSAEFMHQELKQQNIWYSIAGYSVASATGVMRILNNRHWLSDVLVGAGLGMLSTKVTYLIYPWVQQKISRGKGQNLGLMPTYNGQIIGFVFVCVIK